METDWMVLSVISNCYLNRAWHDIYIYFIIYQKATDSKGNVPILRWYIEIEYISVWSFAYFLVFFHYLKDWELLKA